MWLLVYLMLSHKFLKMFSFLEIRFCFCSSDWVISIVLSYHLLGHSSVSPGLRLIPSGMFFQFSYHIDSLWLMFFLYIFWFFVKILTVFFYSLSYFNYHSYTNVLNSLPGKLFMFSVFSPYSLVEKKKSLFCLPYSVSMKFSETVTNPFFEEMFSAIVHIDTIWWESLMEELDLK